MIVQSLWMRGDCRGNPSVSVTPQLACRLTASFFYSYGSFCACSFVDSLIFSDTSAVSVVSRTTGPAPESSIWGVVYGVPETDTGSAVSGTTFQSSPENPLIACTIIIIEIKLFCFCWSLDYPNRSIYHRKCATIRAMSLADHSQRGRPTVGTCSKHLVLQLPLFCVRGRHLCQPAMPDGAVPDDLVVRHCRSAATRIGQSGDRRERTVVAGINIPDFHAAQNAGRNPIGALLRFLTVFRITVCLLLVACQLFGSLVSAELEALTQAEARPLR